MSAIDLLSLFRRELELCKVQPGEVMAVLSGPNSRRDYAEAFVASGQQLGAEVFHLHLPQPVATGRQTPTTAQGALWGVTPLSGHRSGIEILKKAGILVDLVGLLHSPEQLEIQKAGTRVLMVVEPPDILARMLSRPDSRPRVEAAGRKIAAASQLRVTSPAGTDLTYQLGQYSRTPILQYGYTDQPGRWDHWPGVFAYTWPNEGQSEGVIVLRPGDIIFPFKEFIRSEVRITVRDGFITDIGGGFDAEHLSHFMAAWNDPDAYAMAHIGWGLDEMALWNGLSLINKESSIGQDGRAYYGNVLWSTGPNTDVGGTRMTPAHLDIAMKGASLYLDGEPMVLNGDVVPAEQKVVRGPGVIDAIGVAEGARRIRAGTLSSEALVRSCLERIADREPAVGAWTWIDPERALAAARKADRGTPAGPLHGVPIAAKDIIDTFDMPTGLGFAPYADRQPSWDAACVAACRRAGAIVLGKTVTTEFAYFSPGKTRNPHDLDATPGGSSSGSAAAVADGMVPLAFGSQTAGSLVRPAAFCGLHGYKGSHGEFSLAGIRPLAESLDSLGLLARNVEDLRLLRDVLLDRPVTEDAGRSARPPRLGLYKTAHWEAVQPAGREAVEAAVERLRRAGAQVEAWQPPASLEPIEDAQRTVLAYEAAQGYLFEYVRHPRTLSPPFRALCDQGRATPRERYLEALAQIAIAQADVARAFAGFDAWVGAAALGEAPPASDGTGDPVLSRPWTALQAPAVALPAGVGPRGLPLGIQLLSPKGSDDALLATAAWVADRLA